MEIKDLYREIVNEHNLYPAHRGDFCEIFSVMVAVPVCVP